MKFGYTHKSHSEKIVLICYNQLGSCLFVTPKTEGSKQNERPRRHCLYGFKAKFYAAVLNKKKKKYTQTKFFRKK